MDLERDWRGRDALGFIAERCSWCGARLYLSDTADKPICLNACALSVGAFRQMQSGLASAAARIRERENKDKQD